MDNNAKRSTNIRLILYIFEALINDISTPDAYSILEYYSNNPKVKYLLKKFITNIIKYKKQTKSKYDITYECNNFIKKLTNKK